MVSAAAAGTAYLECTQHLTAAIKPWSECVRGLIVARPILSLGIAVAAVVLVSLVTLSRLLRK